MLIFISLKKIAILTEGSANFGFGHIVRCLSFYDELTIRGFTVEFIIEGDDSILKVLLDRNYRLYNWHNNVFGIIGYLKKFSGIILDTLHINQIEIDELCKTNLAILSIDDFLRNRYTKSIVLDWTINSEKFNLHKFNEKQNLFIKLV